MTDWQRADVYFCDECGIRLPDGAAQGDICEDCTEEIRIASHDCDRDTDWQMEQRT